MTFQLAERAARRRPVQQPSRSRTPTRTGGFVAAFLLVVLGAAGALWFASRGDSRIDVVAVSHAVHRGDPIAAGDLIVVRAAVDGARARLTSPAVARTAIVGHQALVDLAAGTLITPEMVGSDAPPPGDATVGVHLTPDELPSSAPRAGDWVQVVTADHTTGQPSLIGDPVQVASVTQDSSGANAGDVVVYLTAPAAIAQAIAGAASTDAGVHLLGVRP